jgi:hypothetical protein
VTQCSETSAFNTQTPGKYPEDHISLLQHGESLKTRMLHELRYLAKVTRKSSAKTYTCQKNLPGRGLTKVEKYCPIIKYSCVLTLYLYKFDTLLHAES